MTRGHSKTPLPASGVTIMQSMCHLLPRARQLYQQIDVYGRQQALIALLFLGIRPCALISLYLSPSSSLTLFLSYTSLSSPETLPLNKQHMVQAG